MFFITLYHTSTMVSFNKLTPVTNELCVFKTSPALSNRPRRIGLSGICQD